jgi:hypothetical protein
MICFVRRSLMLMSLGALLMCALGFGLGEAAARGAPTRSPAIGAPTARPPARIALAGRWYLRPDPGDVGLRHSWGQGGAPKSGWSPVSLPNDFNPAVNGADFRGQTWWYETTFTGPALTQGRSWRLAFEGVRRNATVFLNGYQIGENHDPYTPFSLPATSLRPRRANTLIIRVDDDRGAAFPEDWWNWGGITGPVTLQPQGRLTLADLGVIPQLGCRMRCGDLLVQGTLTNSTTGPLTPRIQVVVTSPSGGRSTSTRALAPLRGTRSQAVSFPLAVRAPTLWSPAHPSLYRVEVRVLVGARTEQDETLSVGMRSVTVAHGILFLNGTRLWLHGASIHEDIDGHGAALTDADIATLVSELKAAGANITRAHYPLSPRLLDAFDRAGILVWAQPPVDHADATLRSAAGRGRALAMLRTTLLMDRSHPSVVVDSVANELSVTPSTTPGTSAYLAAAIPLARRLSPGTPVGLDVYCYTNEPAQPIYRKLDVLGIDDYFGWGTGPAGHSIADFNQLAPYLELQHSRYPDQALVISEYGAEAFYDGPATTKGTYEFQDNYIQQTYGVLDQLPFMNGSLYWTLREFAVDPGWTGGATLPPGYTPDGIHHKGLIAYDGTDKPAFAIARQLFATTPSYVTGASSPPPSQPSQPPSSGGLPGGI